MAMANRVLGPCNPFRLAGALAATTVIGNNASAKERIYTQGFAAIAVRYKGSALTGTCTAQIHAMLSDAQADDTVGTRAVSGLPTAVTDAPTTERIISYTLKGEQYVEFELSMSNGGADTVTVTYCDVFLLPLA